MGDASLQSEAVPHRSAGNMRLLKGMWIWNTAQLIVDNTQIDRFLSAAASINLTDVYLYVAPQWYNEKGPDIASFNARVNASGIRVWALDGEVDYIDDMTAEEKFMDGLRGLARFNSCVQPGARFHGFQADIEPQDNAGHEGYFHNGIPESKLTEEQHTQRDILMHKWLNVMTRASALLRSYELPFGAAMPFWLHDYEGEPVTVPWGSSYSDDGSPARTCIQDLIMPLLDEYVIMSYNTDPANAASRVLQQARYASAKALEGCKMPRVLGSLETERGAGRNVSYGDTPGKEFKTAVLNDIGTIEEMLQKYPAFHGMAIHHWAAWDKLPL
ncbi:hypothetical protein LTR85_009617 [Meristemomyces frigidus]|nr:hypothetical protein LTR85_009617 [Meristemomyces frigidus]